MSSQTTDQLVRVITTTMRHVTTEATNDVDRVMQTVSQNVCYIMPDVTSPDAELTILTDREAVRAFYSNERTFLEVVSGENIAEVTSDWYTLHENRSVTREVATGTLHTNEVLVLFPVADDGIIGEILITRQKWFDVYGGTAGPLPAQAPDGDVAAWRGLAMRAHDRLLDGIRSGDVGAAAEAFTDKAEVAVVDLGRPPVHVLSGTGPDATGRRCAMVVDALDDREVVVLNRVVGDWYVFADWVVRGTARPGKLHGVEGGRRAEVRSATIYPVGDDRLLGGEQGYSVVRALD